MSFEKPYPDPRAASQERPQPCTHPSSRLTTSTYNGPDGRMAGVEQRCECGAGWRKERAASQERPEAPITPERAYGRGYRDGLEAGYRNAHATTQEQPQPASCGCQCHGPYTWNICPHCRPDLLGPPASQERPSIDVERLASVLHKALPCKWQSHSGFTARTDEEYHHQQAGHILKALSRSGPVGE